MRGKFHHHASFLVLAALFFFEAALPLVSCNRNATVGCVESERQALLKFKACFIDYSHMLSSWKGNDCCEWKGVGCDKHSNHVVLLALRGTIDDFGDTVKRLDLNSSADDVASSLAKLRFLEHLDLSGNDFTGSNIPQSFGLMEHLRYLNLSYASFGGEIPHQLGNLTRLCILDLSNGYHSVLRASDIRWMSQLRFLQQLDMSRANLSSVTTSPNVFQLLNNLASLTTLKLSWCGLTNSHLSLGNYPFNSTFLGNIKVLDLSGNSINGPVPVFISNMTSLEFLDLSYNHLTGDIPNNVGHLAELKYLDLAYNQLNGSIPDSIGQLSKLETLILFSNQLTGTIPGSIGQLSKLETLILFSNQLTGTIPGSIGQLSKLETLDLSSNQLTGTIPESIGQLSKLETLDLSFNQLIGVIPVSIEYLSRLETLYFSSNQLTGEIPESIGQLFNLKSFFLSRNSLEGVVSEAHFASLSKLTYLYIGFNRLNCELKGDWRPSFHLLDMSINSCKLGTRFPKWIQSQNTIEYLDLSNTSISGHIPENIGYMMPKLAGLDLSDNNINGSIPESLGNLQTLELLDISNNMLSGNIPNSFDQLIDLEFLFLNKNNLSGELPVTLANCNRLDSLDLGENAFSGNITLIGESHFSLEFLRLRKNKFTGGFPSQLCMFPRLRVLDLASNSLFGKLPPCFLNLTCMVDKQCESYYTGFSNEILVEVMKGRYLEYKGDLLLEMVRILDLSENNFTGTIPEEIASLAALIGLNISHNHLSGEIPKNIGQLVNLESLDLSQNDLSGAIPSRLSELTKISRLNLSYNNLSGPIPTGNQLQTLEDQATIYMGNPLLCGPPLLTKCSEDAQPPTSTPFKSKDNNEDALEKMWFYLIVMSGFATGFWGVIGVLIFMKTWRHALFRMVDNVQDKIHVALALKMKQFKKMLNRNPDD